MDFSYLVSAAIGFSASLLFCLPNIVERQRQEIKTARMKIISEALERAEARVVMCEERHDRILSEVCSHYLVNKELEKSLHDARDAINEALKLVSDLRRLQMKMIVPRRH